MRAMVEQEFSARLCHQCACKIEDARCVAAAYVAMWLSAWRLRVLRWSVSLLASVPMICFHRRYAPHQSDEADPALPSVSAVTTILRSHRLHRSCGSLKAPHSEIPISAHSIVTAAENSDCAHR